MTSTSGTKRVTPQHLILFRQTLGLTQSEAARMLGVTRVTWNRWENGRTHPPDFLLKVLQVAIQTWKREQTKQAS